MCPRPRLSLSSTGIGLGLVGFGAFFILFGMLLYFDSVLLAFGNVSTASWGGPEPNDHPSRAHLTRPAFLLPDPLPLRLGLHHRLQADLHLLLPEAKAEGHQLLPGGGPHRPHALADPGHAAGGLRLRQPLQVCPAAPGCHGTGWGQRQIPATSICQGMKQPRSSLAMAPSAPPALLTEPFVSVQEFFPSGFWVFGLAGKHPHPEQGEQGAGQGFPPWMWCLGSALHG